VCPTVLLSFCLGIHRYSSYVHETSRYGYDQDGWFTPFIPFGSGFLPRCFTLPETLTIYTPPVLSSPSSAGRAHGDFPHGRVKSENSCTLFFHRARLEPRKMLPRGAESQLLKSIRVYQKWQECGGIIERFLRVLVTSCGTDSGAL
jgi:hypothetical protein